VGQQRCGVITACDREAAGRRPGPACRIVQFRAREIAVAAVSSSSCDDHVAVGQRRYRLITASDNEAARRRPSPGPWIIQFRAREVGVAVHAEDQSSYDEYLAVRQQRRRCGLIACGNETASGRPSPAHWIVQFRARESAAVTISCYG